MPTAHLHQSRFEGSHQRGNEDIRVYLDYFSTRRCHLYSLLTPTYLRPSIPFNSSEWPVVVGDWVLLRCTLHVWKSQTDYNRVSIYLYLSITVDSIPVRPLICWPTTCALCDSAKTAMLHPMPTLLIVSTLFLPPATRGRGSHARMSCGPGPRCAIFTLLPG